MVELDRHGFEYEFYLQHKRRPDLTTSQGFAFRAKVDRARHSSNEPRSLLHEPSVSGAWVRNNVVSETIVRELCIGVELRPKIIVGGEYSHILLERSSTW